MRKLFALLALSYLVTACGAKTGSSAPVVSANGAQGGNTEGHFIDSPVGGLGYRTESFTGMTDDSGKFNCNEGEKISFFLKGNEGIELPLGESLCHSLLSPVEIATESRSNISVDINTLSANEQTKLKGLLRILQSLSVSDRPDLMLTMDATVTTAFHDYLISQGYNSSSAIHDLLLTTNFESKFAASMTQIGRTAVSEAAAMASFNSYKEFCTQDKCTGPVKSPTPTPVPPTAPVTEKCYDGTTYGGMAYPQRLANYPIDTTTGDQVGTEYIEKYSTTLRLKSDGTAEIYREKYQSNYFKMSGGTWSEDASGNLTVENVQFSNKKVTLKFGAESLLSGLSIRYGTPESFGKTLIEFDRMWRLKKACYIPSQLTPVTGP